ncbi:MAG: Fur family zinc uptake transcriptional regulator [Alteromonadaceae bacterium]|jgi:Fur family zinc uptake transcriptional regulator
MSLEHLVQKAALQCEKHGARFTPVREKVFRLLANSEGGVGAYDLLEQLKLTEPNAKPTTIYRALEFLAEQGFTHKIESTNAYLLCHHFEHTHPAQLLICDSCGHVEELQSAVISNELKNKAQELGFNISKQTIEARGLCGKCQAD